jgi:hypothetical protein
MLFGRGDHIPHGREWLTQVKVDGVRGQLRTGDGPPSLRIRHGRQCAPAFPEIIAAAGELPDTILDGEIAVIAPDGAPDFCPHGLIPVAPVMAMTIDSHGQPTGSLRDPITAAIDTDPAGP